MKMKKRTKLTKLTAVVLSILFVLGSLTTAVAASGETASRLLRPYRTKRLDDVKRLLNASSYDEYTTKHSDEAKYPRAERDIVINGLDYE